MGALVTNFTALFQQHQQQYSLPYKAAAAARPQILANVQSSKDQDLKLDKAFYKDANYQVMQKVAVILEAFLGFRGGKEQTDLLVEYFMT